MISPVLEKLSIEVYPDAVFAKVDVDEAPVSIQRVIKEIIRVFI
jgi:hypothetical protein